MAASHQEGAGREARNAARTQAGNGKALMALIGLSEAVADLNIVLPQGESAPVEQELDLLRKIDEASDIVLDWVTADDKDTWDESTAPDRVKAATKLVLQALYDGGMDADPLSPAVKNILRRLRRPTLA